MRLPPLNILLSWPVPNYVDPIINPLATVFYVLAGILLGLASIAIAARLYARVRLNNWFGLDDLFIVLALLPAVGLTGCLIYGYRVLNWDRHVWDVPVANLVPSVKLLFAAKILFAVSSALTRMSLVFFYYRILNHIQINKYRWILHLTMFFIVSLMITWVFVTVFNCTPVYAYWSTTEPASTRCINGGLALLVLSAINTLEELIVALLPIPVVLRLRMETKQRLGVISLLSLGIIVALIGSIRSYYVWRSVTSYDLTWYSTPHWICAMVEVLVAIICACVPALRHLVRGKLLVPWGTEHSSGSNLPEKSKGGVRTITERYHPYATGAGEGVYQTIDFDGAEIDEKDAFGHSVNIMSDAPRGGRKMYGRLSGDWRFSLEEPREPVEPTSSDDFNVDDIGCRKSLEIRVSYHEGSNDVKSLHIHRPEKVQDFGSMSYSQSDVTPSFTATDDAFMDGQSTKPGSSWLVDETSSERSSNSDEFTESGSEDSDGEKSYTSYDIGVAVQHALTPSDKSEKKSVSLSEFDFDPQIVSRASSQSPSTTDRRQTPDSQPRRSDLLRPNPAFIRRSLSTIASETTRGDQRSSVNRSSNGGEMHIREILTRPTNFGPGGLPEIRRNRTATPTDMPQRPQAVQQSPHHSPRTYSRQSHQRDLSSSTIRQQVAPSPPRGPSRGSQRLRTPSSPQLRRDSRSTPTSSPQLRRDSRTTPTNSSPRQANHFAQGSRPASGRRSRGSQHTQPSQPPSRRQSRRQSADDVPETMTAQAEGSGRRSSQSQRGQAPGGAGAEWWLQYSPPEPTEPTDGTLWSFAFNRIFSPQHGLAAGVHHESTTSDSDETKRGDGSDADLEAGFGGDETSVEDNADDDFDGPVEAVVRTGRMTPRGPPAVDSWFDNRNSSGS